jgi:DNA adenine methylase
MKYMGSKNRIAKHILPIMLKDRKEGQYWVEPFVGGANMIDKVTGNRIGADSNKYLIALLSEMTKEGFGSPDVDEVKFLEIKNNKSKFDDWIVGYAGFQLSFGAMWFSGYRKDKQGIRNYSDEAKRNVDKQSKKLKGITFINTEYKKLEIPCKSIIYCDPPYENTAKYKAVDEFNHGEFWQWCRDKAKEGHTVFVSEYNAPDDFECIWQQELNVSVAKDGKHKKAIEKLFTIK